MKAHINANINPTGATSHGDYSGSSGQAGAINAIGHGSNTAGSSGQAYSSTPINPTGATSHGGNTNQSGQIDTTGHSNSNYANGQISATSPTGATSHSSTVSSGSSGQAENKPTINPDAVGHSAEDLYMSDGDDYYIDDNALSNAQMKTDDNETAASVVGGGGGDDSETNSNINTGVFGGSERAAHPGYSLW